MNNIVENLKKEFENNANLENAIAMKKYMKDKFEFFGIKKPIRDKIQKQFLIKKNYANINEVIQIIDELWTLPEREFQYFALNLIDKYLREFTLEHLPFFEKLIITKSWWDTVDMVSQKPIGIILKNNKNVISSLNNKWIESDNIWLNRTAFLFQMRYKNETDLELLTNNIHKFNDSKEFFIQKAIGWILREISKTNPDFVINITNAIEMAPLSKREALKVLNRNK